MTKVEFYISLLLNKESGVIADQVVCQVEVSIS